VTERGSYEHVAREYYDVRAHPTSHNLNRLSRLFIERRFPEPWDGRRTLEVGAGASSVAALLHARGYGLEGLRITDSSPAMLRHSARWRADGATLDVCDASATGAADGAYDILVAGLADPFNTPAFWAEAGRVLAVGGRALFTTPSFEWSTRYRDAAGDEAQTAEFVLTDGHRIGLPSLVTPFEAQMAMCEAAGFAVVAFESLGAHDLHPAEALSPKVEVFDDGTSSLVWGFALTRRGRRGSSGQT
jgi:hypothetical protein